MPAIIKPIDTITLQIDNRTQPCTVDMRISSDLPIPFVIHIFANLIAKLSAQMAQAMATGIMSRTEPNTEPVTEPVKSGSSHA